MKRLVLALATVAAFSGSASAADMAGRPYTKAPAPVAAVASWTGFWISGGFGYGFLDVDHSVTAATAPFAAFDPGRDTAGRGWLGKVGVGFDYQFIGNFVIGASADIQRSSIRGQTSFACPGGCLGSFLNAGQMKNDWSWAAGGRIGYVALPGLLTYVNAGYTQAHFAEVDFFDPIAAPTNVVQPSARRNGYFLGGGTEYAIPQIPGLFWKSEYRFSDFGNRTDSQICVVAGSCGAAGSVHSLDHNHAYEQTATTELVYRFNWGGAPMAAKY